MEGEQSRVSIDDAVFREILAARALELTMPLPEKERAPYATTGPNLAGVSIGSREGDFTDPLVAASFIGGGYTP